MWTRSGPARMNRWDAGAQVVWRSRPGGEIGFVFAAVVLEDGPSFTALFQPKGAPCKRRSGERSGPAGRQMLPGGWEGRHDDRAFAGPSTARVHPVGSGFAVLRHWDEHRRRYQGWYVNLERPWRRTQIGFDGRDDVLEPHRGARPQPLAVEGRGRTRLGRGGRHDEPSGRGSGSRRRRGCDRGDRTPSLAVRPGGLDPMGPAAPSLCPEASRRVGQPILSHRPTG